MADRTMAGDPLSRLRIERSSQASRAGRSGDRRIWLIAAAVLIAAAAFFVLSKREVPIETINVSTAYPYQAVTLLNATGYVVAQRKAAVSTKATGRLEWLGVQEGSVVKQGEVIARLESRDVAASAEQAAANVLAAQAEVQDARLALERARDLAQKKFVSASNVDTAQARFDKAKAGLAVAEANRRGADVAVEQTRIRAPFDGVVLTKAANMGDIVTPFSSAVDSKGAVVTMADMATLEVEADVSESNLARISVGQPCEIALDAFPELRLRGEVSRLVPTVDRAKASVMTKVRFIDHDPRVLPEMSAKVAFLSAPMPDGRRAPLTVVHADAIVQHDGKSVVFRVKDGQANVLAVKTGEKIGDLVEIRSLTGELQPGDKLVLRPPERLRDGGRVTALQK